MNPQPFHVHIISPAFPYFQCICPEHFDLDDLDQGQLVLNLNATEQLSVTTG